MKITATIHSDFCRSAIDSFFVAQINIVDNMPTNSEFVGYATYGNNDIFVNKYNNDYYGIIIPF